ncbi:MAG: hypothetical protein OQJ89_14860 [Kangiellaceae bacterium]|nr:hypothetical protein [Kangiellaceae bacterium]MCW9000360.1 hypothetical protein [Kangiellaceae bacterium]MCW9018249.1 hypothetical protein [Kangiellaceae bacterium]
MELLRYLSNVKKRPGMYMADNTALRDLELQLCGYDVALEAHGINNDLAGFNVKFREYVFKKTLWSTCCGWAQAITDNSETPGLAVEKFFELADAFLVAKGIENAID